MKLIIFSDLDGTLLEHNTYSFEAAKPALKLVEDSATPLILCTSKTAAEIKFYQEQIGIKDPFISEDGGAIYIPKGYFNFKFKYQREEGNYLVIEFGTSYDKLRKALNDIKEKGRKKGLDILGFGDMNFEQLVEDSGLTPEQARLAKIRGYDEPFKFKGDEKILKRFVNKKGLRLSKGGRYYHITGKNDKGKAVKILTKLFKKKYKKEKVKTIGIGDSSNDFSMLKVVKIGYLVQKINSSYASEKYLKAEGIGPKGWNKVIQKEVSQYLTSREYGKVI